MEHEGTPEISASQGTAPEGWQLRWGVAAC